MGFLGDVSLFIQGDSSILNGKFLLGTSVGGDETEAFCQQTEHASASISELQALKAADMKEILIKTSAQILMKENEDSVAL